MEYEILQAKKIILIALQCSPSIQKPSKTDFHFLPKCQSVVKTKWQELHLETSPTLEDLPEDITPLLPFTSHRCRTTQRRSYISRI